MAVRRRWQFAQTTSHLAISSSSGPAAIAKPLGDVERLITEVVKLGDHGVGFAAFDAGVRSEELDQVRGALSGKRSPTLDCSLDVPLTVERVVLLLVCRAARAGNSCRVAREPSGAKRNRRSPWFRRIAHIASQLILATDADVRWVYRRSSVGTAPSSSINVGGGHGPCQLSAPPSSVTTEPSSARPAGEASIAISQPNSSMRPRR